MRSFLIDLFCPKFTISLIIRSIHIVKYHKNTTFIITCRSNIYIDTQTQVSFGFVTSISVTPSPKQFCYLCRCFMLSFRTVGNNFTVNRTQDRFFPSSGFCICNLLVETNNCALCAFSLSCLVSKLQKPAHTGTRTQHFSAILTFFMFSFWSQEVRMSS
jgi:hypothetical protein